MRGCDSDGGWGWVDVVCKRTDAIGEALVGRGTSRRAGRLSGGVGD